MFTGTGTEAEHLRRLTFAGAARRYGGEVPADMVGQFENLLGDVPHAAHGEVLEAPHMRIRSAGDPNEPNPMDAQPVIEADLAELKEAWQKPLRW